MYFGEGWQDFAVAHDLSVGFLLVFKYRGNMEFKVTVFDLSACEREYNPFDAKYGFIIKLIINFISSRS